MLGGGGLGSIQYLVSLTLSAVILGLAAFALLDALRHRPDAYVAASKRSKQFWLIVTGLAMALALLAIPRIGFLNLIAAAAAGVYLADVRPALRQVQGRGGGSMGPYGPW